MARVRWLAVVAGLLVVAALTASCGGNERAVEYAADWPHYDTVEALYSRADLVVEVQIRKPGLTRELRVGSEPADTSVYTVVSGTVARVYKGDAKAGDTIEIKQLGGRFKDTDYQAEDVVYLTPSHDYLVFLAEFPDAPASPLNPPQSQYRLEASGEPVPLPGNQIRFTVADLKRLS
jgi:hypothetical protein